MFKSLLLKIKESTISVAPVVLLVIIVNFTPIISLSLSEIITFICAAIFLIIGISLFNLGAELAMTPMGQYIGEGLTKSKKLILLVSICFIMGVFITIAEPDLSVLATQVSSAINSTKLIIFVGLGVGTLLLIGVLKIVFKIQLSSLLIFFYLTVFAVSALLIESGKGFSLPLSFDSGGVTTGPITVPFIMALGTGIAKIVGGKKSNENSFGLVALCSVGPILVLLLLLLFSTNDIAYVTDISSYSLNISSCGNVLVKTAIEVLIALGLICVFFIILQIFILKLPKNKLLSLCIGIIFTYIGLVVFLSAVTIGFLPIGFKIGTELANNTVALIIFAFVIGMVVVLAEPAIHVLNNQVEATTNNMISKKSMLIALSIGVGLAIGLSIIRIIFKFSILYYIIPGYIISLGLSFFVPKIYTSIAFDAGGVASGPLTSSFILPFAIGVAYTLCNSSEIMNYAFGIVAMVAMVPLISIQVLGFKSILSYKVGEQISLKKIYDASDDQIIKFM